MLPELWVKIFEDLDCENILNIKLTCQYFNKLCEENELYIKRKHRGFPRIEGRCECHDVTEWFYKDTLFNKESIEEISLFLGKCGKHLIRGDLMYFYYASYGNRSSYCGIFDGHELMKLDDYKKGTIPRKFRVINDNVPINYWDKCIPNSIAIWFDQTKVQQQCINNITFDSDSIWTNFTYNERDYIIKYIHSMPIDIGKNFEQLISDMKNIFVTNTLLILSRSVICNSYVLFLNRCDYKRDQEFNLVLNC